jgi:hypothetical protein
MPKPNTFQVLCENSIPNSDSQTWGANVQGIFINVDWQNTTM